jgi:DNA-directed RNA polymerase subunit RPC12/RpoP
MESHNIKIEVNAEISCPKCENGHLLPFLRAEHKKGFNNPDFDHYEIVYRCSNCNYKIEKDTFMSHGVVY